jgi:hypothetical protein
MTFSEKEFVCLLLFCVLAFVVLFEYHSYAGIVPSAVIHMPILARKRTRQPI